MNITISVGTIVKVALTLAALWVFYIVRELALVILSSVVLASAIEPMVVGLTRRGISRTLAVLMIYVLAFVIIIGLVYFLLPPLLVDFGNITASIPERLQSLSDCGKSLSPLGGVAVDIAAPQAERWGRRASSLAAYSLSCSSSLSLSTLRCRKTG